MPVAAGTNSGCVQRQHINEEDFDGADRIPSSGRHGKLDYHENFGNNFFERYAKGDQSPSVTFRVPKNPVQLQLDLRKSCVVANTEKERSHDSLVFLLFVLCLLHLTKLFLSFPFVFFCSQFLRD